MLDAFDHPAVADRYPRDPVIQDPAFWERLFDTMYAYWLTPQQADWACERCGRPDIVLTPGDAGFPVQCAGRHLTDHQQKRRKVREWQRRGL